MGIRLRHEHTPGIKWSPVRIEREEVVQRQIDYRELTKLELGELLARYRCSTCAAGRTTLNVTTYGSPVNDQ